MGFFFAFHALSTKIYSVFILRHGLSALSLKQNLRLKGLMGTYSQMTGIRGLLTLDETNKITTSHLVSMPGCYLLIHEHAVAYIKRLGLWIFDTIENLFDDEVLALSESDEKVFVKAADEMFCIFLSEMQKIKRQPSFRQFCRIRF